MPDAVPTVIRKHVKPFRHSGRRAKRGGPESSVFNIARTTGFGAERRDFASSANVTFRSSEWVALLPGLNNQDGQFDPALKP